MVQVSHGDTCALFRVRRGVVATLDHLILLKQHQQALAVIKLRIQQEFGQPDCLEKVNHIKLLVNTRVALLES